MNFKIGEYAICTSRNAHTASDPAPLGNRPSPSQIAQDECTGEERDEGEEKGNASDVDGPGARNGEKVVEKWWLVRGYVMCLVR